MFGIGGGELVIIIIVALMLFGSEKVPEIARTIGKITAQVRHATNDLKTEIQKSAEENNMDLKSLTEDFNAEIDTVKQGVNKMISDGNASVASSEISSEINQIKENFDDLTGPIKRQM